MNHLFKYRRSFSILFLAAVVVLVGGNRGIGAQRAEDAKTELRDRREAIRSWASVCPSGPNQGQYSEISGVCAQGDVVLFAGLGCLAATLAVDAVTAQARCSDVLQAQGPDGRWWRGPTRVEDESPNSFSRDMARGVLAYLTAHGIVSQDPQHRLQARRAASRWWQWIQPSRTLCPVTPENPNCGITLGTRSLMYHVFSGMNLNSEYPDLFTREDWAWLRRSSGYPYQIFPLVAEWAADGPGLHLQAASILILRKASPTLRSEAREFLKGVAESLVFGDPENPLFRFLRDGPTMEVVRQVMKRCPEQRPSPEKRHRDFQWQRPSIDRIYDRSDGHDCIFMINLLLADL